MEKQIQKQIVKYSNELAYLKENLSRDFDKLKDYEIQDYENQIKLTARKFKDKMVDGRLKGLDSAN